MFLLGYRIQAAMETGLVKFWENKYKLTDVCESVTQTTTGGSNLVLKDIIYVLAVLACGLSGAIIVLCGEMIVDCIHRYRCRHRYHISSDDADVPLEGLFIL